VADKDPADEKPDNRDMDDRGNDQAVATVIVVVSPNRIWRSGDSPGRGTNWMLNPAWDIKYRGSLKGRILMARHHKSSKESSSRKIDASLPHMVCVSYMSRSPPDAESVNELLVPITPCYVSKYRVVKLFQVEVSFARFGTRAKEHNQREFSG
jgi:hypothetical protein